MVKYIRDKLFSCSGVSIIGAVLTLLILGIFGVAVVAIVSTEHEARTYQLTKDFSFYNVQAGLEYAIREIYLGRYPVVSGKTFGKGTFTVDVNYVEGGTRTITVTGNAGSAAKTHQITYDSFGGDCLDVNNTNATLVGPNKTDLKGITLKRQCNEAITIKEMIISWDPDGGEKVTDIQIKSDVVWEDSIGLPSGSLFDIIDTTLSGSVAHQLKQVTFTNNMLNKDLTIRFIMSDTSTVTITFQILPPQA